MDTQFKNLADTIAFVVVNDRNTIIKLLLQNGQILDVNTVTNDKLVSMLMNSLEDSENFRYVFLEYLKTAFGLENFKNSTGGADGFGGGGFFGTFDANSAISLVTTGLGFLSGSQSSKDQRAAAEAQAKAQIAAANAQASNNQTALQIAQLQLEAAKLKPGTNNTLLYVGIGVGAVAVIGVLIYVATKK